MNATTTNPGQNLLARVSVASPDADRSLMDCATAPPEEPCTVVIMGATGDLAARKLIPSLLHMYQNERLPEAFTIVGCGRTQLTDEQFRNKLAADMEAGRTLDVEEQVRRECSGRRQG